MLLHRCRLESSFSYTLPVFVIKRLIISSLSNDRNWKVVTGKFSPKAKKLVALLRGSFLDDAEGVVGDLFRFAFGSDAGERGVVCACIECVGGEFDFNGITR